MHTSQLAQPVQPAQPRATQLQRLVYGVLNVRLTFRIAGLTRRLPTLTARRMLDGLFDSQRLDRW